MTFGEKLQILRKSNGISQEQLASQIGVSRQAISKWELGVSMPDTDNVIEVSKIFGVSIDYLLNVEIESTQSTARQKEIEDAPKKNGQKRTFFVAGIVLASIGALGNLVIWVLSTMIKVHVVRSKPILLPDGLSEKSIYYGGGEVVGYSYKAFISEYRLQAILVILAILLIVGVFLILRDSMLKKELKYDE
ncbi:MAG: helix-turn-helix transcriptional regulator [Firmicutes bacterium]|nr:helix-turn-helix transcriptional regulator [Bacillota bacterium]MDD4264403.1 helix-turn-helix transcriptional regulator [Bacillota bacterium]MDD4694794.1 helix-turn-helix transcriptional regulator [Bacillota bacterium]